MVYPSNRSSRVYIAATQRDEAAWGLCGRVCRGGRTHCHTSACLISAWSGCDCRDLFLKVTISKATIQLLSAGRQPAERFISVIMGPCFVGNTCAAITHRTINVWVNAHCVDMRNQLLQMSLSRYSTDHPALSSSLIDVLSHVSSRCTRFTLRCQHSGLY